MMGQLADVPYDDEMMKACKDDLICMRRRAMVCVITEQFFLRDESQLTTTRLLEVCDDGFSAHMFSFILALYAADFVLALVLQWLCGWTKWPYLSMV